MDEKPNPLKECLDGAFTKAIHLMSVRRWQKMLDIERFAPLLEGRR